MNREARVGRRKQTPPVIEPLDLTSPAMLRRIFEEEQRSSERRWEKVVSKSALAACNDACDRFRAEEELVVRVTTKPDEVPAIQRDFRFKYSGALGRGNLGETVGRMRRGETITVAWVEEAGAVIAYGIAAKDREVTNIEILDVDVDSRRSSGFGLSFETDGESFVVGAGHLVVQALLQRCPGPLRVDSTTEASRFAFKSLGFGRVKPTGNPCLLKHPA